MTPKVQRAREEASRHLGAIQDLFVPGSKVTLLVRPPGGVEREFLLTDDNLDEAIQALERSKHRKDT